MVDREWVLEASLSTVGNQPGGRLWVNKKKDARGSS